MEITTLDCLKRALLDTQEKVRDFMNYSASVEDAGLSSFFKECAESEGRQAKKLKEYVDIYS